MKTPDWQRQGTDPDYRFTLANERTFLAWIRTALALLASGVLLDQLSVTMHPGVTKLVAIALVAIAAVFTGSAYFRWRANEIAMRHQAPLPPTSIFLLASLLIISLSVTVGVLILA